MNIVPCGIPDCLSAAVQMAKDSFPGSLSWLRLPSSTNQQHRVLYQGVEVAWPDRNTFCDIRTRPWLGACKAHFVSLLKVLYHDDVDDK